MSGNNLYLGVMSGTSADAIDVVAVDFSKPTPALIAQSSTAIPRSLREDIHRIALPGDNEIDRMGELDQALGKLFAQTINQLLADASIERTAITAIGSHGQTIRHRPPGTCSHPFTLQIGDPNVIAHLTGITTVGDFRRRDMAAGGHGAPLVPAFHQSVFFSADVDRVVINIGGMANISWIGKNGLTTGFDTGPGNVLLDCWIQQNLNKPYDSKGAWAASGKLNKPLLERLLQHLFFFIKGPKSTGREMFNLDWLSDHLDSLSNKNLSKEDIQATLVELTAVTIANEIKQLQSGDCEAYVCGGGAFNDYLMSRLQTHLTDCRLATTQVLGVAPQWVEAMAFAWLAKQTMERKPGNLIAVTGASQAVILGGVYFA